MNKDSSAVLNPQDEMAKQTTIHSNLKQDIVCTTKDKLHLSLQNFRDAVDAKQKVATYGGITISLLLSLVTSTPKDTFGLSSDVWHAIFIVCFLLSIAATIYSIVTRCKTKKDRDIEEMCNRIMCGNSNDSMK